MALAMGVGAQGSSEVANVHVVRDHGRRAGWKRRRLPQARSSRNGVVVDV
jgi:hypothetical protein